MALTRSIDPLVWIDCEMTGLSPTTDTILSISCLITDHDLNTVDPQGFDAVIYHTHDQLSSMDHWCTEQHAKSGLVDLCKASKTDAKAAARELLAYVKSHVPEPRKALLAGNSVHADKMFLMQSPWTQVLDWLHYRIFDVSAIKEGIRRWGADDILSACPVKKGAHMARADILDSIAEARYYQGLFKQMAHSQTLLDDLPDPEKPSPDPEGKTGRSSGDIDEKGAGWKTDSCGQRIERHPALVRAENRTFSSAAQQITSTTVQWHVAGKERVLAAGRETSKPPSDMVCREELKAWASRPESMGPESYRKIVEVKRHHLDGYRWVVKYGVKVALGTDLALATEHPLALGNSGQELVYAVREAGMTEAQAIEAATSVGPETVGCLEGRLKSGRIEEGYDADLIGLEVNPLENIEVFAGKEGVKWVCKGGRWVKTPASEG